VTVTLQSAVPLLLTVVLRVLEAPTFTVPKASAVGLTEMLHTGVVGWGAQSAGAPATGKSIIGSSPARKALTAPSSHRQTGD
jgi:hypothetical protein